MLALASHTVLCFCLPGGLAESSGIGPLDFSSIENDPATGRSRDGIVTATAVKRPASSEEYTGPDPRRAVVDAAPAMSDVSSVSTDTALIQARYDLATAEIQAGECMAAEQRRLIKFRVLPNLLQLGHSATLPQLVEIYSR